MRFRRRGKYHNIYTKVGDHTFHSRTEAEYYQFLMAEKEAGRVLEVVLQPKFELQPGFEKNGKKYRPITYIADFYVRYSNGKSAILDRKGFRTEVFKLKLKMFEYKYPQFSLIEV